MTDTKKDADNAQDSSAKAQGESNESLITVLIALAANALIAVAKTFAAVVTGSASMVAEATHSWADTGNEIFLLIAERQTARKPDRSHPYGYGRGAFVWTMFAAIGLLVIGAGVSISNGIAQLGSDAPDNDYFVGYIVLGIAFVLEGTSFLRARSQAKKAAVPLRMSGWRYIMETSDTTVRSVYLEDFSAIIGVFLAATGMALRQITGNPVFDAIGSIMVGLLLGVVAIFLLTRNAQFLVGRTPTPLIRRQVLDALREHPEIESVSLLQVEFVGPRKLLVIASVLIEGNKPEKILASQLQKIENEMVADHAEIVGCILSLSGPGDPGIDDLKKVSL